LAKIPAAIASVVPSYVFFFAFLFIAPNEGCLTRVQGLENRLKLS
jgi:hypothetical protein